MRRSDGLGAGVLVERDTELAALRAAVARAVAGAGSTTVLVGPPGIGKTALLDALASDLSADLAGIRVLRARGGELEREFPLRRDAPAVRGHPAGGRRAHRCGAAVRSGASGDAACWATSSGDVPGDAASLEHAFYWLTVNLSDDAPVVLVVDDAHWADLASLRALVYLARRVADHRVAVVIGDQAGRRCAAGAAGAAGRGGDRARPRPDQPRRRRTGAARPAPGRRRGVLRRLPHRERRQPVPRHRAHRRRGHGRARTGRRERRPHPHRRRAERHPQRAAAPGRPRPARDAGRARARRARRPGPHRRDRRPRRHAGRRRRQPPWTSCAARTCSRRTTRPASRTASSADAVHLDIPTATRSHLHGVAARRLARTGSPPDAVAGHLLLTAPGTDRWVFDQLVGRRVGRARRERARDGRGLPRPRAAGDGRGNRPRAAAAAARRRALPDGVRRGGRAAERGAGAGRRAGVARRDRPGARRRP